MGESLIPRVENSFGDFLVANFCRAQIQQLEPSICSLNVCFQPISLPSKFAGDETLLVAKQNQPTSHLKTNLNLMIWYG